MKALLSNPLWSALLVLAYSMGQAYLSLPILEQASERTGASSAALFGLLFLRGFCLSLLSIGSIYAFPSGQTFWRSGVQVLLFGLGLHLFIRDFWILRELLVILFALITIRLLTTSAGARDPLVRTFEVSVLISWAGCYDPALLLLFLLLFGSHMILGRRFAGFYILPFLVLLATFWLLRSSALLMDIKVDDLARRASGFDAIPGSSGFWASSLSGFHAFWLPFILWPLSQMRSSWHLANAGQRKALQIQLLAFSLLFLFQLFGRTERSYWSLIALLPLSSLTAHSYGRLKTKKVRRLLTLLFLLLAISVLGAQAFLFERV
ncbi:MAG: Uncharacterised protein [Flavobacteriia bacterium]|nr:MAG: Uncharacterised protein [Flavobacteriia bacterium]